jgi:tyrosyl-tRNA synthetase
MGSADDDVYRFLRYFTFLSVTEIEEIREADAQTQGKPQGQRVLADEVTRLVHGEPGLQSAARITRALFEGDHQALSQADLEQLLLDGLPSTVLNTPDLDKPLTGLLVDAGVVASGKQAKDALSRSALHLNGRALGMDDNMSSRECFSRERSAHGRFFLARLGKRTWHLFVLQGSGMP